MQSNLSYTFLSSISFFSFLSFFSRYALCLFGRNEAISILNFLSLTTPFMFPLRLTLSLSPLLVRSGIKLNFIKFHGFSLTFYYFVHFLFYSWFFLFFVAARCREIKKKEKGKRRERERENYLKLWMWNCQSHKFNNTWTAHDSRFFIKFIF